MAFSITDLSPQMQKQVLKILKEEEKEKQALLEAEEEQKKHSKYRSEKITLELPDGTEHTFDSRKEAKRYNELLIRLKAGEISDLRLQVKYVLIPAQYEPDTVGKRGGIKKGKLIERECSYIADFVYTEDGQEVVEDCKGYKRGQAYALFVLKRKMMLDKYGIRVVET